MGIERFFSTISNKFNLIEDIVYPYPKKYLSHIFIDFNSIVHVVSSNIENPTFKNVILAVEEYIINLLSNNFYSNQIKFIMIAVDGVPSKAKMIEQKRRRYMGELTSLILNKKNNKWSKNNISPGTYFMHSLSQHLNSDSFKNKIKQTCINLNELLVSDIYSPEEGEKKITNKINKMNFKNEDTICIYSPDSDVILLSMIIKKDINIYIYRHDQQKSSKVKSNKFVFNIIEINRLKEILINYIKDSKMNFYDKQEDQKIINDVVLIFTIFGDDFLPKVNSYDVKNDINIILELYTLTLMIKKKPLIENSKISFDFFTRLLEFMSILEDKIFESNKLDTLYHNYKKYSSIKFDINLNKLQNAIKDNKKFTNYEDNFIFKLSNIIDKKEIYDTLNRKSQYYHFYFYFLEDSAVIEELINYCMLKNTKIIPLKNYKKTKNKIFPLKLLKYSISSKDKHHQNNMKDFNKDQKEEYILMNKLDEYQQKLNVEDGLKHNNIVDDKLIYEYLKGINWIYQYYFEDNLKNKYWFYPSEHTPLIKDIYQYLKLKKNLKFTYKEVSNNKNFFTVLEQLLFITPFNYNFYLLDNILNSDQINKVKKFVSSDKYKKFYFDLEKIAKEILFDNKNEQIDCHNALYLNKCRLIELSKHLDPTDEFINDFRKYISVEEQNNIYKIIKIYQRSLKSKSIDLK